MAQKSEISASRSVAFDLLRSVTEKNKSYDEAMVLHDGFRRLPGRDKGFARLVSATALRRLGQIDAVLNHCMKKPLPKSASVVRDILRLASTEILFLKVAPHAAVDSAVTLVESRQFPKFKGLTNAVLRRLVNEGEALLAQFPNYLNIPKWMLEAWQSAYGTVVVDEIVDALLIEPMLDLSVKEDTAIWAERLEAQILSTGSLRRSFDGPINLMPGFDDGAWWVQDAGAAIPARLFGDVSGMRVLDVCAAPGGKTAQLAAAGAKVTALDRSSRRLKRLESNLMRLGLTAELVAADATEWVSDQRFDAVLLDPPCSATGTIRRHPDILYSKTMTDLAKLTILQEKLLIQVSKFVKPGGQLIFCTCSLQAEEGEMQIGKFLKTNTDFQRKLIKDDEVGECDVFINKDGDLRTLPFHLREIGGIDGFFASRLVRK
jgi:16S rRNA (cytosine967-C5)-methyltransferase